jgi:membrane protease YdiL (CAAX protease family)
MFSTLMPRFRFEQFAGSPLWIWVWLLQMFLVIPFWVWIYRQRAGSQVDSMAFARCNIPVGRTVYYLVAAYFVALLALPFHDRWFGQWLVFGGIVSPIFEELFSRNLLAAWLNERLPTFLGAAAVSSSAFALMHWGFDRGATFELSLGDQGQKFISHFAFGMILCLVFRFTKSVQLLIWLHIAVNLRFVLTKL